MSTQRTQILGKYSYYNMQIKNDLQCYKLIIYYNFLAPLKTKKTQHNRVCEHYLIMTMIFISIPMFFSTKTQFFHLNIPYF